MIEQVTPEFFDSFLNIVLEIFFAATAVLYYYWIRPFVHRKYAVYPAAFLYWLIAIIGRYTDSPAWLGQIMSITGFILPCLMLYLLDERRNPLQKILICAIFSLIWWIMLEMMSELGFYERDLVMSFETMRTSIAAAVIEFVVYNVLFYSIAVVILFLSFRLLHKAYKRRNEELTWREFIMLLAPTSSFLVVKPIIRSYFYLWMDGIKNGSIAENIPGDPFRIVFCVLSYASILVIIIFYQQIKDRQEAEFERRALENQTEDMHRHMEQIEDTYEKMRAMRHDMGSHMTVIRGLVESGKTDEASEYISAWTGAVDELGTSYRTGNPFTDAAISGFGDRFAKAGIPFEQSFVFPAGLGIDPFDMCVILSNALQNAYEASVCAGSPAVRLASVARGNTFIINIKNKINGRPPDLSDDGIPYSTKKEDGHGYGLKNIRNIARRYNGEIEIRIEETGHETEFVLNVMLIG